jgi:hypothetical protein
MASSKFSSSMSSSLSTATSDLSRPSDQTHVDDIKSPAVKEKKKGRKEKKRRPEVVEAEDA